MAQLSQIAPSENWKPRFSSMSQKSKIVFDFFPTNALTTGDVRRHNPPTLHPRQPCAECPGKNASHSAALVIFTTAKAGIESEIEVGLSASLPPHPSSNNIDFFSCYIKQ